MASALRGHTMAGRLSATRLAEAIGDFTALTIHRHSLSEALNELQNLRDNFTVYDAAYAVLASALDAPLVTADTKLCDADRLGVEVRLLPEGRARG